MIRTSAPTPFISQSRLLHHIYTQEIKSGYSQVSLPYAQYITHHIAYYRNKSASDIPRADKEAINDFGANFKTVKLWEYL